VLLVTHDAEAASIADRRYTLRDGRLLDRHASVAGPGALSSGGRAPG
jgi:ABC-type lipoprotein export system ATPase subunit